ncbi:MAG: hypothetical protein KY469_05935 [Actinobacteria bacterium]|nr:hypothetical protein [Actinomycetota bacterium]
MRPDPEADFDIDVETAEATLERVERGDISTNEVEPDLLVRRAVGEEDGMHLEEDQPLAEDEITEHEPSLDDAVLAFIDCFNARDLDGLCELLRRDAEVPGLGNDVPNFQSAVDALWSRSPTCMLTPGRLEEREVAVMWESADGRWWKVATLLFSGENDGRLGLVELVEDPEAFDGVVTDEPEREFDEGSRWEEWEEGAADP